MLSKRPSVVRDRKHPIYMGLHALRKAHTFEVEGEAKCLKVSRAKICTIPLQSPIIFGFSLRGLFVPMAIFLSHIQ